VTKAHTNTFDSSYIF